MTPSRYASLLVALAFIAIAATSVRAGDPTGCEYYAPVPPHEPTGVKGCEVYGVGTASMWGGPGIARNDCTWPFTGCQPIAIRSLDTGLVIIVTPSMYGDLYTTTPDQRIVDLDPQAVAALGLDPSRGLWRVEIWPVNGSGQPIRYAESAALPDTSMGERP